MHDSSVSINSLAIGSNLFIVARVLLLSTEEVKYMCVIRVARGM